MPAASKSPKNQTNLFALIGGGLANTKIMGVLNITPDSFADGGKYLKPQSAIKHALLMIEQGADIIDVGGESSRPWADKVSTKDELERVITIIQTLRDTVTVPISIDTTKPKVMKAALAAGATMINDVNALQADGALEIAAATNSQICLMHRQGSPKTMQNNPVYDDIIDDIKRFFAMRIDACIKAGIKQKRIVLDPGFGFGKTLTDNIILLKRLAEFKSLGLPILIGLSRKSMIGALLNDRNVDNRLIGSVVAAIIAARNGADIVRVHDVLATKDGLTIWQKLQG